MTAETKMLSNMQRKANVQYISAAAPNFFDNLAKPVQLIKILQLDPLDNLYYSD